MTNYTSMYIKRADGTGVPVDVPSDDSMRADYAPIALAMSAKVSAIAAVEQSNATWQMLALMRETALAEAMARPSATNNAAIKRFEKECGARLAEVLARFEERLEAVEARQASPDDQHAALVAKGVSEHLARQNQSSEPSTAGMVTVATPNSPADPERQVNLLAGMTLLLDEFRPFGAEAFNYAAAMVKMVQLYFERVNAAATAPSVTPDDVRDFDPWALANQLEREEMSGRPTAEEIE